jgi:hypothetical protein
LDLARIGPEVSIGIHVKMLSAPSTSKTDPMGAIEYTHIQLHLSRATNSTNQIWSGPVGTWPPKWSPKPEVGRNGHVTCQMKGLIVLNTNMCYLLNSHGSIKS